MLCRHDASSCNASRTLRQATVMTMSYFVQRVEGFSVARSTLLFVAIGLCMFLLPPVPGAPVYLASGVLLTSVGLREGWGFWGAAAYAIGVAFCIKLGACALQQKLIGETLGRSVAVRKLVAINSTGMKVARIILRRRGLSLGKVAILVGFPDWPCSVGCGIMRLPLLPVLLGTTPVIMLVLPLSLAGSFLIKGCEQPYPSLCTAASETRAPPPRPSSRRAPLPRYTIAMAVSAIAQVGAMVTMLYCIEHAAH